MSRKLQLKERAKKKYETQKTVPIMCKYLFAILLAQNSKAREIKGWKNTHQISLLQDILSDFSILFLFELLYLVAVDIMQGSLTFLAAIYIFLLLFTSFFICFSFSKNKNVYICILSKLKLKITSFNRVFIFLLNFFSMCLRFINTFLVRWFHGRFSAKNYRRSIQFHLV